MSAWALFLTVAVAHQLAMMSPGPDFAVVTQQTLRFGRRAGVLVAAGIASSIVIHLAYGLFGLSWITQHVPGLLDGLRLAGGAVLILMGAAALRPAAITATAREPGRDGNPLRRFGLGFATNLLNPKAALFFVALFTSVISAQTSIALRLALAGWIVATTFAWFAFVALTLSAPGVQARLQRHTDLIQRGMALLLVALGAGMLWAGFQPWNASS